MMDTIRKPFSGPSIQKLKETLTGTPHFVLLGEKFPAVEGPSTEGHIKLSEYFGDGWGTSCMIHQELH
jgi:hypothetical protein